ncbi:MAG: class II aldolase/adducin family protein [Ruminococcaceae bacterium]|nr:class II aldolase/adducin family protein [Oscillospiraceae bacterium]
MKKCMHPADRIVATMNRLYYHGMTTVSGGNLSIMDQEGNMWISPSGVDKGALTREDIMKITPDGQIIGRNRPSVEYPFHLSVLRKRPDFKAVLHAHPTPLVGFSLMRIVPDLTLMPDTSRICGKVIFAKYAVPGSQELGDLISAEFEKGYNTVMLENHGVVIGAPTMEEAFRMFEALDFTARVQIAAATMGKKAKGLTAAELARYEGFKAPAYKALAATAPTNQEIDLRNEMMQKSTRAYELNLFSSVDGVWSARLANGGQLITPEGFDPLEGCGCEMVRVVGDAAEADKTPSKYAAFCAKAYEKYPEINSVIVARCPSAMAFAQTGAKFDARLIPESYIQLKDVPVLPFMSLLEDPDKALEQITPKNPVAIIEGDCLISMGTSVLAAYDHLEVLEYSARALVSCAAVGQPVVTLDDAQIKELHEAFNL